MQKDTSFLFFLSFFFFVFVFLQTTTTTTTLLAGRIGGRRGDILYKFV